MFDLEYNANVGFIPRFAYLESMAAASEEDVAEVREDLDTLSEYVDGQAGDIAVNAEAIADETAAREEAVAALNERIDSIPAFDIEVVDTLPKEGVPGTVYLVKEDGKETYSEYVYADGKWERLGTDVDLSGYVPRDEFEDAIGAKADMTDVYSRAEADATFLTEHQDISGLATRDELSEAVAPLASEDEVTELSKGLNDLNGTVVGISGAVVDVLLELDSVDEKLAGLADANAAQDVRIDSTVSDYKKLKEIVGDLGGDVEYAVPGDAKLTDALRKSGTVKLTEDIESATYAGGLTSKNVTTLNTNGKTLTFTGTTANNPGIMTRGAERLTVVGKGTVDGNGRIAIEANGADSVINLSGSTGFFGAEPTYVTDRSGGELIYCYLGTINIYAGVFMNKGADKGFTLNCYDANYRAGKANIVVTGGKFYDFDPADNNAEGNGTSFVPEGYESVHTTEEIDGVTHDVYTVKKSA